MDTHKWLKSPPTVSSAKSDITPTSPDVVVGVDPGRQSEPEPVASSSVMGLGLAGPAAATVQRLPAAGQVQLRLGPYLGHNCLSDQCV